MEKFKYHYWILHKKMISSQILRNLLISPIYNGLRILKPLIPEHPFPLAGLVLFGFTPYGLPLCYF